MITRNEQAKLLDLLEKFPAVGIIGPRQIGKTTLARNLINENSIYLDLESDLDQAKLTDPGLFLRANSAKTVILDEIQYQPRLFPLLRSLIDEDRRPGRFIILGSASPDLLRQSSESLAGRIAYLEIPSLRLSEVGMENQNNLWVKGGYPESLLEPNFSQSMEWRTQFIRAYIERDLPLLGLSVERRLLLNFLKMLAGQLGQIWNASSYAKSLGIASPTVKKYLDFLEKAFLVDVLEPFHSNIKKRLIKSPKIYFRDTGLVHSLFQLPDFSALQGNILVGASWENFVIQQIKSEIGNSFDYYFYRSHEGTEMDLVVVKSGVPIIGIEIKYSDAPKVSKGMRIAMDDLRTNKNFIITPTSDRFAVDSKIDVVSLGEFLLERVWESYLPTVCHN